jgi:hypothetical protein
MDGQHRFRAAEAHGGIDELPCVIIAEREAEDQASSFVAVNTKRVSPHPFHAYQAAVVAGDPYRQDHIEARRVLQLAAGMIEAPVQAEGRSA